MSAPQARGGLSITQLAARVSVRPDTIRYYERTGLLPAPARTAGDHRRYDERALDRLQFIRGAKRLGLRLDAIAELLELRDAGQCPCEPAAEMLRSRLAEIDAEMARLAGLRGQLVAMLAAIPGPACPDPAPGTWCPVSAPDGGTAISTASTSRPPAPAPEGGES
ncbi:MAG TPA: MerR family DNA-binding protein [Streptosporangiaceae bacterium]|nr:MerR family DNA-binding protein [Streptosporangiaceae bacterium]